MQSKRTFLSALALCCALSTRAAAQEGHGWEKSTARDGFSEWPQLIVASADSTAVLSMACVKVAWQHQVHIQLGTTAEVFVHSGRYDRVFVDARFLPDSSIVTTVWRSQASSGSGNIAIFADELRQYRDPLTEKMTKGFLDRLTEATAVQLALPIYAHDRVVATFPIPNRAVLVEFLSRCPYETAPPKDWKPQL